MDSTQRLARLYQDLMYASAELRQIRISEGSRPAWNSNNLVAIEAAQQRLSDTLEEVSRAWRRLSETNRLHGAP